ncbi:MAG: AraC family transcriptional regulator [Clostridia bacterium]|nr:AraC family transcriptional regulator [Clostridia bacterium]
MNDQEFYKSFAFHIFSFSGGHHRDNSAGVQYHYIGRMIKGRGLLVSEDKRLEVFEGDAFYIPNGCKYHSYWTGENGVSFYSLGFAYFPRSTQNSYQLQKLNFDEGSEEIFKKIADDCRVSLGNVGLLYSLLDNLEKSMSLDPIDRRSSMTERAIQYMYQNPLARMSEVAQACQMSESTLYSVFKKVLGKTPNEIHRKIQCEKAAELLKTTNLTIEEISRRLEFSSSSYFRKVLFSVYGKTPRQIRRESKLI